MSISSYHTPESESSLPELHLSHTTPDGHEFHATVTVITQVGERGCYILEAGFLTSTRQYASVGALQNDWSRMKRWLNTLHPAPEIAVIEDAKLAAVAAPMTETIIRLSDLPVAADAPTLEAAPTLLLPAYAESLRSSERAHELKNDLKRLFMEKMSMAAFKVRRAELQAEIAACEAQTASERCANKVVEGELYFGISVTEAVSKYLAKHDRQITTIKVNISKYDHADIADGQLNGIQIERSGSVFPRFVYVGGK